MSEEKKTSEVPTAFVIAESQSPSKGRQYKKYIIVGGCILLAAAIILTAILVGLFLFTEAQKEVLKFSYNRDKDTKEEVTSDPNTNIVQYHVTSDTYEAWIVEDFNRDIRTIKKHSADGTNCYLAVLNRTIALDPSKISILANPEKRNVTYYLTYHAGNNVISDSTFLSKTARDTCTGLSTYWLYPTCDTPDDNAERKKRWGGCLNVFWGFAGACIWF